HGSRHGIRGLIGRFPVGGARRYSDRLAISPGAPHGPSDWVTLGVRETRAMISHRSLYESVLEGFVRLRGTDADRNWRAFLWCATVRPDIWAKVEPCVEIGHGRVDWLAIERELWSGGERLLMSLARALYENTG